MVNIHVIPITWIMANGAINTKRAVMFIFTLMAGVTIRRRTSVSAIDVTLFAGCFNMLPNQFEVRKFVIKLGGLPAFNRMTISAILPKSSLMLIISGMTGETILRRGLQIQHATSIQMTFRASYICMPAGQIKCEYGMVEIISELIHSIMTGKAICPEGQGMRLGEDNVHFAVAVLAGVG